MLGSGDPGNGFNGRFQPGPPGYRQLPAQEPVGRIRKPDDVRGREGGYHRNRYDDRIDELPHDTQGAAHTCQDESEFTQLGEAESGVDTVVQSPSSQYYSGAGEEDVADDHDQGKQQDQSPVFSDSRR